MKRIGYIKCPTCNGRGTRETRNTFFEGGLFMDLIAGKSIHFCKTCWGKGKIEVEIK